MTRFRRVAIEVAAGVALLGCAIMARGEETPAVPQGGSADSPAKFVIHGQFQSTKMGPGPNFLLSDPDGPILFTSKDVCEAMRGSDDFKNMIERMVLTARAHYADDTITEPTECVEARPPGAHPLPGQESL